MWATVAVTGSRIMLEPYLPVNCSQMWVESHAVFTFFFAWSRLHLIKKYTAFANYGLNNLPWLFGHCLCQDFPFVLCCSSCVQQPNTVRLLCRRDFLRRSQNHGLHSFVEVPPELRSTNFPGRIGVFLRLQQFVPLDLCTSSRATNTYDRFNKPSGITNSAVNIGKT